MLSGKAAASDKDFGRGGTHILCCAFGSCSCVVVNMEPIGACTDKDFFGGDWNALNERLSLFKQTLTSLFKVVCLSDLIGPTILTPMEVSRANYESVGSGSLL